MLEQLVHALPWLFRGIIRSPNALVDIVHRRGKRRNARTRGLHRRLWNDRVGVVRKLFATFPLRFWMGTRLVENLYVSPIRDPSPPGIDTFHPRIDMLHASIDTNPSIAPHLPYNPMSRRGAAKPLFRPLPALLPPRRKGHGGDRRSCHPLHRLLSWISCRRVSFVRTQHNTQEILAFFFASEPLSRETKQTRHKRKEQEDPRGRKTFENKRVEGEGRKETDTPVPVVVKRIVQTQGKCTNSCLFRIGTDANRTIGIAKRKRRRV